MITYSTSIIPFAAAAAAAAAVLLLGDEWLTYPLPLSNIIGVVSFFQ